METTTISSTTSSVERMQCSLTSDYVVKTTQEQKRSIDQAVSMFFYAANIHFNVVELDNFKHMIEILRPGYKPPSAKDISGRLLDAAAQQVDVKLEQKVRNCSLTLSLSGWSSVKNDPIQAVTIHTGAESFLLKVYDPGSQKKTSEQCASIVEEAINECYENLHSKVFAVVTDNENKMWDILKEKYPDLITYGCSAHLLNLVEKDVTPKTVMCHIVEINKHFRNVHKAFLWLMEQGGLIPQLPNDTRWKSHLDSVGSFVFNYHKYREIARAHSQDFSTNIAQLLNNVGLYREAVHLEKRLSVVADARNKLQKETTCISEAVEIWLNLLSSDALVSYHDYILKRFKQAIQPPHILANLTDPKFRGHHLSEEQENSAVLWLAHHHPEYLPGVLAFKIRDPDYYPASMMDESVIEKFSSPKWWQIMAKKCEKNSKLPPGFGDFFFSLHSAPASSASIERYSSTFGLLWSMWRNRLGIERATKLVKVYHSLQSNGSVCSTWECASCWVKNPERESKCLACETPRFTKDSQKATAFKVKSSDKEAKNIPFASPLTSNPSASTFTFKSSASPLNKLETSKISQSTTQSTFTFTPSSSVSSTWECASCWVRNPEKESKCLACETSRPVKDSQKTEVKSSSIPSSSATWECSECWVKNPVIESKCMACESPCTPKESNKANTSSLVNQTTKEWECSSCWVKNPANVSKCMACESVHVSKDNTEIKSTVSSALTTWECTSCWVRNPMKEKKCMACETLHPDADKTSSLKDTNGFKFSTPIQSSPIAFKFGNYVCTAASTVTTSSFTFGLATSQSQTTTSTTGFKFGVPSSTSASPFLSSTVPTVNITSINKETVNTISSQVNKDTVNEIPVAGKDSVKESNTVSGKNSADESSTPVVKDEENKAKTVRDNLGKSLTAKSSEAVSEQSKTSSSESKMLNSVITNTSSETSVSKAKEGITPSVTSCFSFTTQPLLDSKKSETFPFGGLLPKEKLSSSSLPSPFGVFTPQSISLDKSTAEGKSLQLESKTTIVSSENKITPGFQFTSQTQQVSSAFTVLSSAPAFKFGEKTDSSKTNSTTISVAPTSSTNAGFSFSNKSNPIPVAESKDTKLPNLASQTVSPFVKAEVTETTSTTTNTFVFGSTTTTSAPTGFSFFPSSSTTTTTTASSLFTLGAFSNNAQTSKPGGFTFKGLEKPQNIAPESSGTTVSSASQPTTSIQNTNSTAQLPSGGFVFGAPKTEAQSSATAAPFTFGSGTVSSSNTSAFSAFQPSQPANNAFQFGIQPTATAASTVGTTSNFSFTKSDMTSQVPTSVSQNPVSSFGAPANNFVFGAKNETPNQIANTVTQASGIQFGSSTPGFSFANKSENTSAVPQNSNPTFGSTMPGVFGNASVPTFGGADKPASGGFNFGAVSSGVFQFGASNNSERKRPATASGFSFGTPAASEPNSSFQQSFNVVTPPSFNFGAASTPAGPGPFQFAASSAPKTPAAQSAPRKYRKALRRVRKD